MTIGDMIKRYRLSKGLTQKALAEMSGLACGTIQQYESGKRQPRLDALKKIANSLNTSPLVFMSIEQLGDAAINCVDQGDLETAEFIKDIAQLKFDKTYPDEFKLRIYFDELNQQGKEEALKRVQELTEISKYTEDINNYNEFVKSHSDEYFKHFGETLSNIEESKKTK